MGDNGVASTSVRRDLQGKENRNSFKRIVDAPKHCSRKRKRDVVSHCQRHSVDKHHSSSTSTGTDKRHELSTKRRHKLSTGKKHAGDLKKEKMSKKEEKRQHKTLVKKHAVYNKEVHDAENSLRKRLQNMLGLEVPLLQQENQKACLESMELASQDGEFDGQDGELGTMESQEVELESQEGELGSQELVLEPQVVELSDSDEPAGTQYIAEECLELAPDQNIESEEPAIDSEIVEIPVVKIPIEVIDILSSPESCSDIELDQTSFEKIPCNDGETTAENVVDHEDISHKDTGGNILEKTKTTVINTAEEDEVLQLRLIALRSAVMKKHLERKKRGIRIRTKRQQARETLIYPPDIPLPPTNREQGDTLPSNGPHQSDSSVNTEPDEITTIVDMELADTDDEKDMSKPTTDQEAIHWNSNRGEPTMYSNEPIWEPDCPRYNAGPPFNNDGMLGPHDYENTFYRTGMHPHEYYQDPGSPHIPAQFYPDSSDVYSKCPPIPTGEPGELVGLSTNEEHLHKMPAIHIAKSTAENSAITKKSVVDYVKECLKDILETTKKHKSNAIKVSTPSSHDGHVLTTNENGASPINAGEFIGPSSPVNVGSFSPINVGASSQVKKDDDSLSTKMSSYIDRTSLVLSGSPEHVKPISSKYPFNYVQPSSPKQPNNTPSSILSEIQKQQDDDDDELLLRERLLMALKCKNAKSLVDPLKAAPRVNSMLADTTSMNSDISSTNTDTSINSADTKLASTVINHTQAESLQSAYSPTQTVESLQRNFTYKRKLPPKCQQPTSGVYLARKRVNAARLTTKGGPALSLQVTVPTKEPPEPRKRFVICLGEESDSGTEEDPEMSHEFERSVEVFLRQAREKQEAQTIQGTTPISIRSMPLSQQQEYRRLRDQIAKLEESNHQQRLRLASKNIKAQLPLSPSKKESSSVPLHNTVLASSHNLKQINLPNDRTRTRGRGTRTISKPYFTNKFTGRRVSASKGLVVTIPGAPPNAGRSTSSLLVQEVSSSLDLSDVSDVAEKNGTCNESWIVTNTNKDEVLKCHDGHSSSEDCVSSINKNKEATKEETSDEMDVDSILATNVVKSSKLATCKDGLAKSEINERSKEHLEDLQTQLTDVEQKLLKQRYAVLNDMTVTLDLLNQLDQERSNKDILSEEVKQLRAQLLSAEGRLAQQRKVLQTVRTQTSESYNRVVEGKTACLGLSRRCLMLGISLRGKQYKVPTAAAKIMVLKLHQLAKLSQRLKRRSGGEENVITREPPSMSLAQKQVENETQNLSSTIHETRLVSCSRTKQNEQTDVSISCSDKTQNLQLLDEQGLVGDKVVLNANSFEYIPFSSKNSADDEELTYEEPTTLSLSSNCLALEHTSESSASGTIYRDKVLGLDIDPSRTTETSWTLPADWIHTSPDWAVKIDPLHPLCPYDLRGACRDVECQFQHTTWLH
uniref:Putative zinc-finger domain-containing protein n=1 Tax=Timema monikensis TaxID=170555 RepID=A0A7R9EEF0_9NEOP|nr:unnamed protein product [Timema monikensis]